MKSKFNILVLGGSGLVGSSLVRTFKESTLCNKLYFPTRDELDLFDFEKTKNFIETL